MTQRVRTLLDGRKERLERLLGRPLSAPQTGPRAMLSERVRGFLCEEAEDLYWNELEWENITDEEAMGEGGFLTELAFPGFLAFVRGLLLTEVMPDAKAPASPRPEVVEDILEFLAGRVIELSERIDDSEQSGEGLDSELDMTSRLVDLVLYRYHGFTAEDVEKVEAERRASA